VSAYQTHLHRFKELAVLNGHQPDDFCLELRAQLGERITRAFTHRHYLEWRAGLIALSTLYICEFGEAPQHLTHHLFLFHQTPYGKEHPLPPVDLTTIFHTFAPDLPDQVLQPTAFERYREPTQLNPYILTVYWTWKRDILSKISAQGLVSAESFAEGLEHSAMAAYNYLTKLEEPTADHLALLVAFLSYTRLDQFKLQDEVLTPIFTSRAKIATPREPTHIRVIDSATGTE
jgi:hypothetical protein